MYLYLVCAVAFDRFRIRRGNKFVHRWFNTSDVFDEVPALKRGISAITLALLRGEKQGLFEKRRQRKGYYWQFKLTHRGKMFGEWALERASEFDRHVQLYTLKGVTE